LEENVRELSDEDLIVREHGVRVHGTTHCYRDCAAGPDGKQCARCKEAKRRRNKLDQDRLRVIDPMYFIRQGRRYSDAKRAKRGLPPIWTEDGTARLDGRESRPGLKPPYAGPRIPGPQPDPSEPGYVELPSGVRHGRQYAYRKYKCRCRFCRAAATAERAKQRRRKAGALEPGESKGWDDLPVEHLAEARKGDGVTPLASRSNQRALVKLEEPSKGRNRGD
jgi:hypothetical protein